MFSFPPSIHCFRPFLLNFHHLPFYLPGVVSLPFLSPQWVFFFFFKLLFLSASSLRSLSVSPPPAPTLVQCEVRGPSGSGQPGFGSGRATAERWRGECTGAPARAPQRRFPPAPVAPPVISHATVCSAVCCTVTFVLRAAITKPWTNRKKVRWRGVRLVSCQNKYVAIRRKVYR